MRPSTVIFDFDGTLHDSMHIYRAALKEGYAWLVEQGQAAPRELTEADIEANIGLTAQDAWARMCPGVSWEVTGKAAERVGARMHEMMRTGGARLFAGVEEVLQRLADDGHALVFLSNCSSEYLAAARMAFGLDRWFSLYYAAQDYEWAEKEDIFPFIEHEAEGPFIVVGDRDKDIEVARVHGLRSVGCLYGYGTAEELHGATCVVEAVGQIPAVVASLDLMQ